MNRIFSNYIKKLYFQKWIIGVCQDNIKDVIRNKTFDPKIKWLFKNSFDKIHADPFLLVSEDEYIKILLEELKSESDYGKIVLLTLDKAFKQINRKVLLDTKSHLSYPFVFREENKIFVFPEARRSGKLSCYEYDSASESLNFVKDILEFPLLDSTILKHTDKYWIFGTLSENVSDYKLYVFYSDSLLGPYVQHPNNPVKSGLDGTRSAGNFIEVDGIIYRPSQNCQNEYGESITISRLTELDEKNVVEEPHMTIYMDENKSSNKGMHKIHTINVLDKYIVVDGKKWTFAPFQQLKDYINRNLK